MSLQPARPYLFIPDTPLFFGWPTQSPTPRGIRKEPLQLNKSQRRRTQRKGISVQLGFRVPFIISLLRLQIPEPDSIQAIAIVLSPTFHRRR
ncbi:hypothetical protein HanIR_Chr16g0830151 [Helianthus annuus]|nr:hypothetical protein HanIR_Chr16g0830151 [Helianthus annuus]